MKILRYALEKAGYKDASAILEVANATPNAETAIEIILGIYEEPYVSDVPCGEFRTSRKGQYNMSLKDFDRFSARVHYQYQQKDSTVVWTLADEKLPTYEDALEHPLKRHWAEDAWKLTDCKSEDEFKRLYTRHIIFGGFKDRWFNEDISLSTWNGDLEDKAICVD